MAITKCKECGGKLSTKAESCPTCGAKVNVAQKAIANLLGGVLSLAFFLWLGWLVLDSLANSGGQPEKKDPQVLLEELEAKCAASAKEAPSIMDKKSFYDSCVAGGRGQLRASGLIE